MPVRGAESIGWPRPELAGRRSGRPGDGKPAGAGGIAAGVEEEDRRWQATRSRCRHGRSWP
ncbi:hypothetical protein SBRY_90231 [Actinacidiphila bryophytorum]|uniref:Uncharacterized protein n=1 Tax=Actinacidiphila bryophytorum TaxID=1436133 RepID=A0A9W4H8S9_9ACTN|nr:hypothetical protein SBRY_90231 [Actinacidiphila bryophytorum]